MRSLTLQRNFLSVCRFSLFVYFDGVCAYFFFLSSGVYPHTLPHSFSSLCVHCSTNLSRSPDICVTSHTKQRSARLIYSITQKFLVKIRMIWTAIIFSSRTIDHLFSKIKKIWPTESGQTIKNWFQSMNEMEQKNSSTRERKTLNWWNDFISFQDRNEWSNLSSFVHNLDQDCRPNIVSLAFALVVSVMCFFLSMIKINLMRFSREVVDKTHEENQIVAKERRRQKTKKTERKN